MTNALETLSQKIWVGKNPRTYYVYNEDQDTKLQTVPIRQCELSMFYSILEIIMETEHIIQVRKCNKFRDRFQLRKWGLNPKLVKRMW